jgi:uncharacterized protein YecT (DUF1311 family)
MKPLVLILLVFLALPLWADNATSSQLVDIGGGNKAVLIDDTTSPDGRYAIGWTVRPHAKNTKPVDWSSWKPGDSDAIDNFIQTNTPYLPGEIDDDSPYELIDGIIDLQKKSFLELPAADPYYTNKNRGYLAVAWSPEGKGPRCALIEIDFRFETDNFWLVTFDASGMHQVDLVQALKKAVDPVLAEKRPLLQNSLQTAYSVSKNAESGTLPLAFNGSTVTFPFSSDVPHSPDDDSEVLGRVTLKLPEGTVLNVSSDTKCDDPFQDDPKLAKADHELNEIYTQLGHKLSAAQKAALKKEQLDWIDQRDLDGAKALLAASEDVSAPDLHAARNKSLLESTQKRIAELQARLKSL